MRVYLAPEPKGLSQAMYRVARGLASNIPGGVEVVDNPNGDIDLQVLHVIGVEPEKHLISPDIPFAMIQYCHGSAKAKERFRGTWDRARMVWSYYNMKETVAPTPFYFAPLGIDKCFGNEFAFSHFAEYRDVGVMTSGYVDGEGAEAISAVAQAAHRAGISCVHLGLKQKQFGELPGEWSNVNGVTDKELAYLYSRCKWVSGLRYIEGFELPVIEGLGCGARPIVFDRENMRHWYDGVAEFVRETGHDELVENLYQLFKKEPRPVDAEDYSYLLETFDWGKIAEGFWKVLLKSST